MPRPRLDHVRKAQIIAAAAKVLAERGYASTRISDIAAESGTSQAAVHYWFASKEELLQAAMVMREIEWWDEYARRTMHDRSPSHRVRALISAIIHGYDWLLWTEMTVLALRDQTTAAERERMDTRWRDELRNAIHAGQVSGDFTVADADDAMFVLTGLLDGLAPLPTVHAPDVTPERVERVWLREAARLLGPGFDAAPFQAEWTASSASAG